MADTQKPTPTQARALGLIAAGGVRRAERGRPFRILTPDGTRIADATVKALLTAGWARFEKKIGASRSLTLTLTEAGSAAAAAGRPAPEES
jgi:hypothetical protein